MSATDIVMRLTKLLTKLRATQDAVQGPKIPAAIARQRRIPDIPQEQVDQSLRRERMREQLARQTPHELVAPLIQELNSSYFGLSDKQLPTKRGLSSFRRQLDDLKAGPEGEEQRDYWQYEDDMRDLQGTIARHLPHMRPDPQLSSEVALSKDPKYGMALDLGVPEAEWFDAPENLGIGPDQVLEQYFKQLGLRRGGSVRLRR